MIDESSEIQNVIEYNSRDKNLHMRVNAILKDSICDIIFAPKYTLTNFQPMRAGSKRQDIDAFVKNFPGDKNTCFNGATVHMALLVSRIIKRSSNKPQFDPNQSLSTDEYSFEASEDEANDAQQSSSSDEN